MRSLENVPVLVTGATGFVGSRLSELLAEREKANVTGIGRSLDRVSYLSDKGVNLQAVDILDTDALKEVVEGKQIIIHTAAILDADADKAQAVNVDATEILVELAAGAGVNRIVHVSTVGVYDMSNTDEVDESTPLATGHSSVYPRTKAQAEVRAIEAAEGTAVEISIVRPSMIYGPGHGIWTEGMFQNILDGNPVMLGDGSANFNPVYIDDVADAIILCAKHPDAAGEAFNVSADITTWRDFMGHYGKLCDKEPKGLPMFIAKLLAFANKIPGVNTPVDQGFIEMASSYKVFPVKKAADRIGWKPEVSLEEGLNRTTEWLDNNILQSTK